MAIQIALRGYMRPTPVLKTMLLFTVTLVLAVTAFAFGVLHKETPGTQVRFSLIDHTGLNITQEDMRGQYLLVYFGFTNCARTCPIQMSQLTQVVQQLDRDKIENPITPVFITVDPERDTVERLDAYLQHFDSRFIGLTGSETALKQASRSFKALYTKSALAPSDNYEVSHSSVIYVVDPLSRVVDYIPFEADALAMAGRIKELIL
jgi:protein SCO1/2